MLSADNSGRCLQNPREVAQIVSGQNAQSMRVKRSDPQKDQDFTSFRKKLHPSEDFLKRASLCFFLLAGGVGEWGFFVLTVLFVSVSVGCVLSNIVEEFPLKQAKTMSCARGPPHFLRKRSEHAGAHEDLSVGFAAIPGIAPRVAPRTVVFALLKS